MIAPFKFLHCVQKMTHAICTFNRDRHYSRISTVLGKHSRLRRVGRDGGELNLQQVVCIKPFDNFVKALVRKQMRRTDMLSYFLLVLCTVPVLCSTCYLLLT